ncbi:hypothetical protein [Winogradskyella endarachnes]|nr:hypothetical protein [Winogradskyella endarachnes]
MVLQEGITVTGKSPREHFETKNHETTIHKLYGLLKEYCVNTNL